MPEMEGSLPVRARSVASIPGTDDFFISLSDHEEWGSTHIVWGELEDWFAVDMIAAQRYQVKIHPEHGTHMRMMLEEMPFRIADREDTSPV